MNEYTECWICNEKFEKGDRVTSFLGFGLCHLDCLNNKFKEEQKQYIEEIGTDQRGYTIFKCGGCGHEFTHGPVNIKTHSIFCPECDQENLVDPETNLYEEI